MTKSGNRKRRRIVDVVLWIALGISVCGAIGWWLMEHKDTGRYEQLGNEVNVEVQTAEGIDWDELLSQNPDIKAWLRVQNTPVNLPVTQSSASNPEYYLHHSFWREWSSEGCPFLDYRCNANGEAMIVYGHHMNDENQMFTSLNKCFEQWRFDQIGRALWDTPEKGQTVFTPVMSMSVDMAYMPIQTFDFGGDKAKLREWLKELAKSATAKSSTWERQCSGATRALTLVTCSSNWSGRRARTLLVFTDSA